MFKKVLIANRGAIATRIIRTLHSLNIKAICIYHESDSESLHVQRADEAYSLGSGSAQESYLNIDKILDIAKNSGAEAIHPGYGFLSENTKFVERCEAAGIKFIGPTTEQIELFGLKHIARDCAENAGVPLVPGSPLLSNVEDALEWAQQVRYPVMLKSTAGGGGIGMQVCHSKEELSAAWDKVRRLSENFFSNSDVFLEKFIARARHIEVQIFGDGNGKAISIGERDCSAQRRNQKVIEECPAPNLSDDIRKELCATAERLMASVNYRNAGTVEFIFDADEQQFYFLEVNTRLQVEHGVTEEVWGIDLVACMIKLAAAELGDIQQFKAELRPQGHAIQSRVYAEDPLQDSRPSAGLLSAVSWPQMDSLRIDTWIESGVEVPALFDPMLAKVISHADNRELALKKLDTALSNSEIYGIETNRHYLSALLNSEVCKNAELLTNSLANFSYRDSLIRIKQAGTLTTIQDFPGRQGYWHVGIPPSGPMDSVSFRLANALLNNNEECAALEITLNGPSLEFTCDTQIAICGAELEVLLDGLAIPQFQAVSASAGQTLNLGKISNGARAYLAVSGGIACPDYLESKSTFTLGQFGGHAGRALRSGDVLHLNAASPSSNCPSISADQKPKIENSVQLRVIYGPHGAPEFFTERDIDEFLQHEWEVHYNSSRTGVRLIGPKPEWARETGGEAGLHPSNIHDNAYAFGSVDFTGDMPVILGPDGPSLGGFVCPFTVISADLWKLGQLKAGSKIQFRAVYLEDAVAAEKSQIASLKLKNDSATGFAEQLDTPLRGQYSLQTPIVYKNTYQNEDIIARLAGDHFLLLEIGPLELDIERRFRVHALMLWLDENKLSGMRELTPGIRSLQIHYDSQTLSLNSLLQLIDKACAELSAEQNQTLPSRIVHIPLSWDDEACKKAIQKYTQSVRPGAPWCPSNLDFIRRINGLVDIDAVKDIVFNANYLVMGLGDVYLGAPVATPVDPRQRLVTTKYNPARTWTAENSVGIGGAYMCVYGMEGPGGYQFVGRTLQMWNRYRVTQEFEQPWLLRFFDQIKFYEVSHDELTQIRRDFPLGNYPIRIEECEFDIKQHNIFLEQHQAEIDRFREIRDQAFNEELNQWRENGQLTYEQSEADAGQLDEEEIPEGTSSLESPVSGSVWKVLKQVGDSVQEGEAIMILESMKMELELCAHCDGTIEKLLKSEGNSVQTGQAMLWIKNT